MGRFLLKKIDNLAIDDLFIIIVICVKSDNEMDRYSKSVLYNDIHAVILHCIFSLLCTHYNAIGLTPQGFRIYRGLQLSSIALLATHHRTTPTTICVFMATGTIPPLPVMVCVVTLQTIRQLLYTPVLGFLPVAFSIELSSIEVKDTVLEYMGW